MLHPLQQTIRQARRRLTAMLLVYGLGWLFAAGLGAAVVFGLADYFFRFDDRGVRIICSLVTLVVAGWAAWGDLARPFWKKMTDAGTADGGAVSRA